MTMQTRANACCWNPMEPMCETALRPAPLPRPLPASERGKGGSHRLTPPGLCARGSAPAVRDSHLPLPPPFPRHLTLASEDHDLYTFDMRRLSQAICVHSGHVSAVLDLDYSPTGTQFVSASYDKTLRLWNVGARGTRPARPQQRSRCRRRPRAVRSSRPRPPRRAGEQSCYNVYHTKRMQRLSCVQWSMDAAYLLSGSDDTNVRLWRAVANERGAPQLGREQRKREYAAALVEKHQHLPEVRRIKAHTLAALRSSRNARRCSAPRRDAWHVIAATQTRR